MNPFSFWIKIHYFLCVWECVKSIIDSVGASLYFQIYCWCDYSMALTPGYQSTTETKHLLQKGVLVNHKPLSRWAITGFISSIPFFAAMFSFAVRGLFRYPRDVLGWWHCVFLIRHHMDKRHHMNKAYY